MRKASQKSKKHPQQRGRRTITLYKDAAPAREPGPKAPELAPAYEAAVVEDKIYQAWEKSGYFNPDNLPGAAKRQPFTIMMPPPNATGTLHIGHAMFVTLEDLMTRFNRLRGRAALWLPGTDHAAIATGTKVEKIIAKEGLTKYDLGREGFLKRVNEFVAGSQATIRKQIRKIGASCDWSREAYTLDAPRSAAVIELFRRMYEDGLIYRGYRIVNWCPRCESTLADDEVEYKEEPAKLYYMKYGPFVVATTRPETKLGDTGVAVHPDDKRYKKWIGQTITVDFGIGPQEIRVITDKSVDMNFGSGMVGLTPAHSAVDFKMAEENGLPIKKVIGEDGKMTALAGKYAGLPVVEARAKFVADLQAKGLIEKIEDLQHSISVCYRCGTVVEPLTSRQWFVDVNRPIKQRGGRSLKRLSLEVVRKHKIEILPDRFEKVYFHWMENLRDWCISRQIWFGHRIPVWYCQGCYVEEEEASRPDMEMETKRHIGLFVGAKPPKHCPDCGGTTWVQDADTLDTWFSSGAWTFTTLGWPNKTKDLKRFHPTQVLETAYDILFFWVARMIMMTEYALGEVPFEKVYLHGLVRDEQGRKMSKSLGNIIDPLDVAAKYGTDAVRLSLVIGTSVGADAKISDEKIGYFRNFTNKLWNISRFIIMSCGNSERQGPSIRPSGSLVEEHVVLARAERSGVEGRAGFQGGPIKRPTAKTLADRWILGRLDAVVRSVTVDLEAMNFSRAGETLRDFTWNELADWYLEIAKIEKGKEKILPFILLEILKLWHPFMPFVTEEIYQRVFAKGKGDMLMIQSWPTFAKASVGTAMINNEFTTVQEIITALRNIRAEYKVEPGKRVDATVIAGAKAALVKREAEIVRGLARVEKLEIVAKGKKPEKAATAVVRGVQVFVPLGTLVDTDAERARLTAEIAEAEKYRGSLAGKLANQDFISRAPAAVVAGERAKLAAQEDKVSKLKDQLTALG
ncbi:MAG: valine--tRNA ligase [Patescibacteria group bacterium]|nr:valine--tRNA ligase [Patescibacteria group bacterium]